MDQEEIVRTVTNYFGGNALMEFGFRYSLNFIVIFILIRVFYYGKHKNKDFVFTFFLFNTVLFLICFLLTSTNIKLGFAFGLFAIFSIFRYRTVTVPVREMGYFFLSVTFGIINALANLGESLILLIICNAILLIMTYILDGNLGLDHENFEEIVYDKIDLIQSENRVTMLADLKQRTGLNIHRIVFVKIDFLKNMVVIKAYYYSKENETDAQKDNDNDD